MKTQVEEFNSIVRNEILIDIAQIKESKALTSKFIGFMDTSGNIWSVFIVGNNTGICFIKRDLTLEDTLLKEEEFIELLDDTIQKVLKQSTEDHLPLKTIIDFWEMETPVEGAIAGLFEDLAKQHGVIPLTQRDRKITNLIALE